MVAQVEGGIRVHRLFSFSHEAFNSHSLKVYSDGALPCARLTSARSGWAVSHVEHLPHNCRSFLSLHLCRDFWVAHGTLLSFPPLQVLWVLSNLPSQSSAFLVSVLYLYIHKMYALHFLYGYVMRLHTVLFRGQIR